MISKEQLIRDLIDGAILHRVDGGASSWCHLEYPDGKSYQLGPSELHNLDHDDRLKPIDFDNRGVPTQYSWDESQGKIKSSFTTNLEWRKVSELKDKYPPDSLALSFGDKNGIPILVAVIGRKSFPGNDNIDRYTCRVYYCHWNGEYVFEDVYRNGKRQHFSVDGEEKVYDIDRMFYVELPYDVEVANLKEADNG